MSHPPIRRVPSKTKTHKSKKKDDSSTLEKEGKVSKFPRPKVQIIESPLLDDEVVCKLVLNWTFTINSGSNQNYRFYANNYKPVVATSTPEYAMFATYATEYDFYCPTKLRAEIAVSNTEAFPVQLYTGFFNDDPGTNPGTSLLSNPLTKHDFLSPSPTPPAKFAVECSMQQIVGRRGNITQDPNYRASTAAMSPSDLLWFSLGARSSTGANFTTGVVFDVTLTMWTQFFARKLQ